jgi:GntR family transcriptional regulator/MocR family aminotransferase
MFVIDKKNKTPLYLQLFQEIKKDIINNHKEGDKLYSIRKVASQYNVSKITVESAYSQLVVEGYIESYPKSGYVVSDMISNYSNTSAIQISRDIEEKESFVYDFFPARLDKKSFPIKLWKRLSTKIVDNSLNLGTYPCGQGELGLRNEIAKYINEFRGVKSQSDQIVICNGFTDSMELLARIIKNDYHCLSIESPGYELASKVFDSYGYSIKKIGIDKNGINLSLLNNSKNNLVYITPSHQFPTGVSMPIANRLKLIQWAEENNGLIIEDDYDSELRYSSRPIPSLQGLDNNDRVVFLGTFSKSLSPAIRVSYMVLPRHLLKLYKESYDFDISRVSIITQKTLEQFMFEGHWERHLRKIRTLNRKKHNLMEKLLVKYLGSTVKIESVGGGLSIQINPTLPFNWMLLRELSKKNSIKLYFNREVNGGDWDAIHMGFGGMDESQIENGINIFSDIWKKCILP